MMLDLSPAVAPGTGTPWSTSARAPLLVCLAGLLATTQLPGCAHPGAAPAGPARQLAREASATGVPRYEEDFLEARLVYQALPVGSNERAELRHRLFAYLLGPLDKLDLAELRRLANGAGGADDHDRALASLRDALSLVDASEIWASPVALVPEDRAALVRAAALVEALFAPRGAETEVLLAAAVQATLADPQAAAAHRARVEALLSWVGEGATLGPSQMGPEPAKTPREVLESAVSMFPAPELCDRLARLYIERQEKLSGLLRRPIGGRRGAIADLALEDAEGLPTVGISLAALYVRAGQLEGAKKALAAIAGKPGDDPELRQLVDAAASRSAGPDAFLALGRRFLPRIELLGGSSTDRLDPWAAGRALRLGLDRHPGDPDLLVLASRVARLTSAPLLALRYLEEAQPALEKRRLSPEEREGQTRELVELSFARLKLRMDPEDIRPAEREAEALRARFLEARRRLGGQPQWLKDDLIDLELARGFVDAGLIERAEPIYERATRDGNAGTEATLQLGTLLLKRGDSARAAQILRDALDRHKPNGPHETIGFVQDHAKLARTLGTAYEASGNVEAARKAWRISAHAWERLMVEHLRRKDLDDSAEAFVEVGRLYYLLGRREEGMQKLVEAIEQNESRDASYIDSLSFLVQRGEVEAALDVFRRAMSRPSRVVSEYVKTYASLWVLDLTRRSGRTPDATAEGYLRTLTSRRVHLRAARASAWYVPLAAYAVGQRSFQDLERLATTPGRRAELFFYEAMKRLADGQSDEAHALWNRVIETKMVSFFEYEMAARYLRVGAPSQPPALEDTATESI